MSLLTPSNFHPYQINMIRKQLSNMRSMLWVGTGCGKTIATLSTIAHLLETKKIKRVLVIAPVRVLYSVWNNVESKKWSHTQHLRAVIVHGSVKERIAALTNPNFDIYGVNYEGLPWLTTQINRIWLDRGRELPFDMVVYDEITKSKSTKSLRWSGSRKELFDPKGAPMFEQDGSPMLDEFGNQMIDPKGLPLLDENGRPMIKVTKGWKTIAPLFKWRTGLTGTPSSNGEMDLFGQFLAIDDGERLGTYITHFRKRFFTSDYMGYNYDLNAGASQAIKKAVEDITISVSAKKNLQLPDVMINDIYIDLPEKVKVHYKDIEKQLFTILESGTEVELNGESGVYNKCLQICNGNMYTHQPLPDETVVPTWENLHTEKCQALDEILEEAAGTPVFSSYSYKMDADMIMKHFKKYKPVNITGVPPDKIMDIIHNWDAGKTPLLIGHAACLSGETKVLTEFRGWVKIIDVKASERVHDGVEFVNHKGCQFSGIKETILVNDIAMTPDHKLLIDNEWVEARNVKNNRNVQGHSLGGMERRETKIAVYDLVDCGSRHRFLIANDAGEIMVSHNSVSHGIDGLQNMGHIVVWFGMTYSLELYLQLNGRFDRQGQKNSVTIHRILCRDTIDEVVKDVIEAKFEAQEHLLDSMEDNDHIPVNQKSIMKDLLNEYRNKK